ncbi:DNA-methyltransferase [Dawidia soli]|uniref:Methyltransferase n=1 Tax=Dawidia soli TaxID=2782352 RepID=A0AAP2DC81_9BACT|nr:site-specific DNA-methyltransferase [Dawidia soli]MBT1689339.1 hypothetical protein [Dawidia soli]
MIPTKKQHQKISSEVLTYLDGPATEPLFINGNSTEILQHFPDDSIDCIITSPPYWGHRQYDNGGIGLETEYTEYVDNLIALTAVIKLKLKKSGSFWLNLGDTYKEKSLQGIPWRVAFAMIDKQGWILRNDVVWNKHKGGIDSSKDKLRNVHEYVFHFVKNKKYYYNGKDIRHDPRKSQIRNGHVVSATGVTGIRYRRHIELSTLTPEEKENANVALDKVLERIRQGELSDFRMIIRGRHRTTHSDSTKVSGRAKDLQKNGFYFLFYHPDGTMPGDVWDVVPEDSQKRELHYAPYPEDLCRVPILATCPENGIVLDPFCGTGTSMVVAYKTNRKSIGIDISGEYLKLAKKRIK